MFLRSCNKKYSNTDTENKTAVVVFTNLNYFDMFNTYEIWIMVSKPIGIKENNLISTNP